MHKIKDPVDLLNGVLKITDFITSFDILRYFLKQF